MRRTILLAGLLAVLTAGTVRAQNWTAEQQGVIDAVSTCWEIWGTEDWNAYLQACPVDSTMRFWWMDEGTPDYGLDAWKAWADAFWPRIDALVHFEHRPLGVQIHGDVALYQFWATWSSVDANGQMQTMSQHRLDVLQTQDGRWTVIGGAGTSAPGN